VVASQPGRVWGCDRGSSVVGFVFGVLVNFTFFCFPSAGRLGNEPASSGSTRAEEKKAGEEVDEEVGEEVRCY